MKILIFILYVSIPFLSHSQPKKTTKTLYSDWTYVETKKEYRESYVKSDTTMGIISFKFGENGVISGEGHVVKSQLVTCDTLYIGYYHNQLGDTLLFEKGGCRASQEYIQRLAYIKKEGRYVLVTEKYTLTVKP